MVSPHGPPLPRFPHQEQQIQSQLLEAVIQSGWHGQHGQSSCTLALDLDEKRCSLVQMALILVLACQ